MRQFLKSKFLGASYHLITQTSRYYRLSAAEIREVWAIAHQYPKRKAEKKKWFSKH